MKKYNLMIKNSDNSQYLRIIKRVIEAWCMVMVLIMDKGVISMDQLSKYADLSSAHSITLEKLSASVMLDGIIPLALFVIFFTFYWQIAQIPFKKNRWNHIIAGVFAAFVVVGYSFSVDQSLNLIVADHAQMIKAAISFVGYYGLFHPCIKICYRALDHKQYFTRRTDTRKSVLAFLDRHPFLISFIVLTLAWLPYLISYYPGIFMGDTGAQISQFFQLPNGTSDYLNLISDKQLINNHHPVLHTVLLGGAVKIGRMLGSYNLGIFLYTLFQYLCMAAALSYSVSYLKKLRLPYWFQGGALALFAFYPVFPRYAVLLSKDTLFASVVLIFEICLIEIVRSRGSVIKGGKQQAALVFLMLLVMMLRQNGLYVILFSLPVLLLLVKEKKYFASMTRVFCISIALYLCYINILLPALSITPGSKREMLSLPFQQTGRYMKDYGSEVTKKERAAIARVLDYDAIGENYDANLADPVKNTYNENASSEDLKAYFSTWFRMFFKHPGCYIEATLNNYYGYFYMGQDSTDRRVRYFKASSSKCMKERINKKGFDFYHPKQFDTVTKHLEQTSEFVLHMPIMAIFQASAFYTWMIIMCIGYVVRAKNYRYLVIFLPAVSVLLVSLVSPVNGTIYFRYMLAVMFMTPAILGAMIKSDVDDAVSAG